MTILIDPIKKQLFEDICAQQDLTSSQVIRRLMRPYIIDHAGSRELPEGLTGTIKAASKSQQGASGTRPGRHTLCRPDEEYGLFQ